MTDAAGIVRLTRQGPIVTLTFDHPAARNAMTWRMYEQLGEHCQALAIDPTVRLVLLRGAGGEAFVAGTDITQFLTFTTGEDGIAYERRIDAGIALIEALPMPTVAVITGWAVGGGLAIATACDFRIATHGSRFGVPIARTLGNTLSASNLARLQAAFGLQRTRRMLMLAELLDAPEAFDCGFLHQVCDANALDSVTETFCHRLLALAPLTQQAVKQSLCRLAQAVTMNIDDLIARCYGSADFHEGVVAFTERRAPVWRGS